MTYLAPAYILVVMDSTCAPSEILAFNGVHLHNPHDSHNGFYEDSDSESNYSGQDLNMAMQLQQQQQQQQQQTINGQPITFHYFCNFPTCDYHSARSDPVKRHRDTHYPDYKPYICNYCQSSSARRDSTREHCLKQHKDDSENAFRHDATIPKPEGWIAYEPKRAPWPPIMN
ncbi:hypothetical protein BGZ80_011262 [Entomortierella chlamydospora]|uniref:C2H2-type domain-containing protein n=1 Tax=Entomortierella chlamydospora TaxID=101097 RepID=A0A9P6MUR2_9FUNG|nr:hypothetical protein BGZ79_009962 [Entomortierella chlamydospora]KAG0013147.1 hypothetical protein BGZ80_011262 [Entomortierella chlamydospora]